MSDIPAIKAEVKARRLAADALDRAWDIAQEDATKLFCQSSWNRIRGGVAIGLALSLGIKGMISHDGTGQMFLVAAFCMAFAAACDAAANREKKIQALLRLIKHENPSLHAKITNRREV
jgi:hypothetical protein